MNIETLKTEFFKQTNSLLQQISTLDPKVKNTIDNLTLDETHIEVINNNISPYIQFIIISDYSVFENNNIELIENINLSEIIKLVKEDIEKNNICKYLQTIYLISNTYNKENINSQTKQFMKQIKTSLTTMENTETNKPTNPPQNTNELPVNNMEHNEENINKACEQISNMFGGNKFMENILNMTKQIVKDPNINLQNLMKQDPNEMNNLLNSVNNIVKDSDSDMTNMNGDIMGLMNQMMNSKNTPLNKSKSKPKKKKK